jgi:putrescine:ornithine antiporter
MQRAGAITSRGHWAWIAACAIGSLTVAAPAVAQKSKAPAPTATTTLERIKASGHIRLGYSTEARPFSYKDESGNPAGYSVALCQRVADAVKTQLALPTLSVDWVPVSLADRFGAVQQGQIDLLCGADTETLARRQDVAFSLPIFPGGIGALLRADAPTRLREILSNRPPSQPVWRASAGQLLQAQTFAVISGTTAEPWLAGKLKEFRLTAKVAPVDGYAAGIQALLDRKADVFFGDRAILLDAAARHPSGQKLVVLHRQFTYEPLALALARGDDAFRLMVDRTLSRLYSSGELTPLYLKAFGEPDESAITFFRWNALPE